MRPEGEKSPGSAARAVYLSSKHYRFVRDGARGHLKRHSSAAVLSDFRQQEYESPFNCLGCWPSLVCFC